jgi:hypothetical protein
MLTILYFSVVNQKNEPEAAKTMLNAIFHSPNDQVLREILQDQVHGAHAIAKIVTSDTIISAEDRPAVTAACKRVLETMRNVSGLTYKRLLEECGLPVPAHSANNARNLNRRDNGPRSRENSHNPQMYRNRGFAGENNQHMGNYGQYGMVPDMNQMMSSMQAFQLGQGMTGSLSPLMINHNSFGQAMSPGLPPMSPTPTLGSFATPHAQLMSPNSDPFNPVSLQYDLSKEEAVLTLPNFSSLLHHSCRGTPMARYVIPRHCSVIPQLSTYLPVSLAWVCSPPLMISLEAFSPDLHLPKRYVSKITLQQLNLKLNRLSSFGFASF